MESKDRARSVLIFGGAGFIGSNWAHRLLKTTGAAIHIYDNLSRPGVRNNLEGLREAAGKSGRLKVTVADVRDAARVERAVRQATEIYHLAAQVAVTNSVTNPRYDFEVNLMGTFNVLEAARRAGRRPFVLFTSTNKVYGNLETRARVARGKRWEFVAGEGVDERQPLDLHSPYGCSKGAADQYVHDYGRMYEIPTVVFRMSCVAGPRQFGNEDQGWVAHFLYSALAGAPVIVYGDGRQLRDVLYVDDLLRAFEAVRDNLHRTRGQIYNVGGGAENTISLLELMEQVERLTGKPLEYAFDDRRPGDQLVYVTDTSKLQRDTGWKAHVNPALTLARIYDWWKHNRELFPVAAPRRAEVVPWPHMLPRPA
ncbi:MAG TPA: GDP-mannose 4,6-dehydratase [Terriglobales bacterium]|nr:GDP-mannose 4,6-dehydratase [Terriglobales bacterium]